MDWWTLYDDTGPVRRELDEAEAKSLVDRNHADGLTYVYAIGPNGERYPEDDEA